MRINLTVPYSQKDAAKALGARWDAARRTWYVIDPEDLTPFIKWLNSTEAGRLIDNAYQKDKNRHSHDHKKAPRIVSGESYAITTSKEQFDTCCCNVLPWEDCEHTEVAGA